MKFTRLPFCVAVGAMLLAGNPGHAQMAADTSLSIAKGYDATLLLMPGLSNRTSYLITPDHKVAFAYSDLKADKHVEMTLGALKTWRAAHRG